MPKDKVFSGDKPRGSDFEFNDAVAKVFDDMLVRSVPFYCEQQSLVADVVKKFWVEGTNICDLGCSTGKTLINFSKVIPASASSRLMGYDNSESMVRLAKLNVNRAGLNDRIEILYGDLNGDLKKLKLENPSVVTMLWTLQFIRPLHRDKLIRWI